MIEPTPTVNQPDPAAIGDANAPTLAPPPAVAQAVTLSSAEAPPTGSAVAVLGYEIICELGRGGMGVVYKARQVGLNRIVALKMILAGAHATPEALARFRAEAEAVARLQHANIVQIYEIGEQRGLPFFSLEYVDGGSLADKLSGTPCPGREAAQLIETLARAMHYAHEHGIVHRDLKPANVLLQIADCRLQIEKPDDNSSLQFTICNLNSAIPKITDFGLAKQLDSDRGQTRTGAIMGTPSYMAPEQAGGSSGRDSQASAQPVGPTADVYALGAILYEMLTGRPPFKAATPLDTVLQVVSEEPVPPCRLQPKLPPDLETISLKCLEKDPRRRYASALALAEDLRRFRDDEPILARPASWWERGVKWARRRPAAAALLVLGIAAPLAIAAVSLVYQAQLQSSNTKLQKALIDVQNQRDAVTMAKNEVEREHKRAQGHLEKALEAVDRMLTRVSDERLAGVPQLADLRKQILEEALDFYRGFLKQEGDEPAVRRETARAYDRTAELYFMLSKSTEAENASKEAIVLQEKLVADYPDQAEYRHDLSKSYDYLGHVYSTTARFPESYAAYDKALALCERLVEQHPDNEMYRESLAGRLSTRAHTYRLTDPQKAESFFRKALHVEEELLGAHPESANFQCSLAADYSHLGNVLLYRRRPRDAEEALDKARDLLQPSNRPPPRDGKNYTAILALNQVSRGILYQRTRRAAQALACLEIGMTAQEQLLQNAPKMLPYRYQALTGYVALAELYTQAKQPARAIQNFGKAIDLAEGLVHDYPTFAFLAPVADQMRLQKWAVRISMGEAAVVLPLARVFAEKKGLSAENQYNLACIYALASEAVKADKSLADDCVRRALELLSRLEKSGYFRTQAVVDHAKKDQDLKPLRERQEFKTLVERLEKAAQKTTPRPSSP